MSNADFCLLVANMYIVSMSESYVTKAVCMTIWLGLFLISAFRGV